MTNARTIHRDFFIDYAIYAGKWRVVAGRSAAVGTTLGDLHRATPLVWLNCEKCPHHAPLACAAAVNRWGANMYATTKGRRDQNETVD